jgi:hypothetical protein
LKKLPSGAGRVVEIEVRTPDGTVVFFVDYAPFLNQTTKQTKSKQKL